MELITLCRGGKLSLIPVRVLHDVLSFLLFGNLLRGSGSYNSITVHADIKPPPGLGSV